MVLSKNEAYKILELPKDSSLQDVLKNYKSLALQWYPEKHKNNPTALAKFQKISQAYMTLTSAEQEEETCQSLTLREMLALFQEVFFGDENLYDGDESSKSESSDSISLEMDNLADHFSGIDFNVPKKVTDEEAISNADALIAEEEREKRKAVKKRERKKRRKLKKKLGKEASDKKEDDKNINGTPTIHSYDDENTENSDVDNEEDLDLNSAFVSVIANKGKKDATATQKKSQEKQACKWIESGDRTESSPTVLRSRQVAIRGNEMASSGHYQEAVDLFSEAIKLNPVDYRFYGNRSYCYDRLEQFERALRDADKAIALSSKWPKGYFRKGRALSGLKNYAEAQKAYEEVLRLDKECEDAVQELIKIRTLQEASKSPSKQLDTSSFMTGATSADWNVNEDEVYKSDDDDCFNAHSRISHSYATDEKMDPRNPEGHTSIWVGNITQDVTEKMLISLFSKYGDLLSIRLLPDKFCAFINYSDKWSVSRAMMSLQGKDINGHNVILRYPDNPPSVTVLRKNKSGMNIKPECKKAIGPVNGNECYFWRTTGCTYGDSCRYKHIKEHQGIDKKVWHETKS